MPLSNYTIHELITVGKNDLPSLLFERGQLLAFYHDEEHSHYIVQGAINFTHVLHDGILISHSPCNLNWCLTRMKNQGLYHQNKSAITEIEELFDFMEIPLDKTELFLEKLKSHRENLKTL
jgi:hypothetical protein